MSRQCTFTVAELVGFAVHPVADSLPMLSGKPAKSLAADIARNGLKTPLDIHVDENGQHFLLDGRNRLSAITQITRDKNQQVACILWAPSDFQQQSLPAFIASRNLHRRNLTKSQIALTAVRLLRQRKEPADV